MKDEIKIDNNSAEITNDNSYIDDINIDNKILIVEEKGKPLSKYKNGDKVFWANYSVDKNWKQYVEGEVFIKDDEYSIKRFSQNPNFKKYPLATFNSNTKVALKPQNEPIYADKTIKNADLIKKKIKVMEQESKVENNSADLIDKKIKGLKIALKVAIKEEKELIKKRIKAFEIAKKMSIPKVSVAGDFGWYNDYSQKEKDAIEKKYGTQSKQYKAITLPKSFDWKNADVIGVQTPTELEENGDDWLDEQGIDKKKFGVTLNSNYGQNSKMLDNLIGLDDESYYVVLYLYEKGTDNLPKSFDWKNAQVINMTNRYDLEEQGINTKKYWVTKNPKEYINQTMLDNVMGIDEDGNYFVLYLYEKGSKQNPLQFADGLRKNQLVLFKNKWFENEDNNKHSENVLLLAQNFGTQKDIDNAVEIVKQHEKDGHLTTENNEKRTKLGQSLMDKAIKTMSENNIMFFNNIPFAKGGGVSSWNTLTIEKIGKNFPYKLNALNEILQNAGGKRNGKIYDFSLDRQSNKYDTFAQFVYSASIILNDTGSDSVTPSGTYFSQKSLPIRFYLRYTIRKDGNNNPITINASKDVAGGMSIYKSIEVNSLYDIEKYINSIIRDNPPNNLENMVYKDGGILQDSWRKSGQANLSKEETKKIALKYADGLSMAGMGKFSVNNKIDEDSFDLDLNDIEYDGGSYVIFGDGSVVNMAITPAQRYGSIDSTPFEIKNKAIDIQKQLKNAEFKDLKRMDGSVYGKKLISEIKYKKGGYTRPSNKINTTGFFLFKTKDNEYIVRSSFFERQNDIEDSLEIQDELRGELGSIIITNSAWKRLSDGNTIKARSNKGNLTGTLTRVANLNENYSLNKMAKGGNVNEEEIFANHYLEVEELNRKINYLTQQIESDYNNNEIDNSTIRNEKELDRLKQKVEFIMYGRDSYSKGGSVRYVDTNYTQNSGGVPYFLIFKDAVGSFAWRYFKYNEGILYNLSDFDKDYYSHLRLKNGEKLFRYSTDRMIDGSAIASWSPAPKYLIKINLLKGLIYFMSEQNDMNDDKNISFETRGIKAEYITLDKDKVDNVFEKYATGGGVKNTEKYNVWSDALGKYVTIQGEQNLDKLHEELSKIEVTSFPKKVTYDQIKEKEIFIKYQANKMATGGNVDYYELQTLKNEESILEKRLFELIDSDDVRKDYYGFQIDTSDIYSDLRRVREKINELENSYKNGGSVDNLLEQQIINKIQYYPKGIPPMNHKYGVRFKGKTYTSNDTDDLVQKVLLETNKMANGGSVDGGDFAKGGNVSSIEKKVQEVNRLIDLANKNDISVIDSSSTWESPMKYKPIKYSNGTLYIEYQELDLYKNNRTGISEYITKKDKVLKRNMEFDNPLNDIAKMYRKALKQADIMFEDGGSVDDGNMLINKEDGTIIVGIKSKEYESSLDKSFKRPTDYDESRDAEYISRVFNSEKAFLYNFFDKYGNQYEYDELVENNKKMVKGGNVKNGINWYKYDGQYEAEFGNFFLYISPSTQRGYYNVRVTDGYRGDTISESQQEILGIDNAKKLAIDIVGDYMKQFKKGGGVDGTNSNNLVNVDIYKLAEEMSEKDFRNKFLTLSKSEKENAESLIRLGDDKKIALITILGKRDEPNNDDAYKMAYHYAKGGNVDSKGRTIPQNILDFHKNFENGDENTRIRSWYMKTYPQDDRGEYIDLYNTFEDLWSAIQNNENVYGVIVEGDSLIRERLFSKLSHIKGVSYKYIYDKWLESDNDEYKTGGGVAENEIKVGDKVIWRGNEYFFSKISNNSVAGMIDEKYHLTSYKKNVSNAILDSLKEVKKMADGGGLGMNKSYNNPENAIHVLHIDNQNWYLEKIDSTHFYMSNDPNFRGMAHHIGQHNGEIYYDEVKQWLKDTQYAKGGSIKEFNLREIKSLSIGNQKFLTDDINDKSYIYENGILYNVDYLDKAPHYKKGSAHRMSKIKVNIDDTFVKGDGLESLVVGDLILIKCDTSLSSEITFVVSKSELNKIPYSSELSLEEKAKEFVYQKSEQSDNPFYVQYYFKRIVTNKVLVHKYLKGHNHTEYKIIPSSTKGGSFYIETGTYHKFANGGSVRKAPFKVGDMVYSYQNPNHKMRIAFVEDRGMQDGVDYGWGIRVTLKTDANGKYDPNGSYSQTSKYMSQNSVSKTKKEKYENGGSVDDFSEYNFQVGDKLDLGSKGIKYFKQYDGEKIIVVDSKSDLKSSKGSYTYPSSVKKVLNKRYSTGGGVDNDEKYYIIFNEDGSYNKKDAVLYRDNLSEKDAIRIANDLNKSHISPTDENLYYVEKASDSRFNYGNINKRFLNSLTDTEQVIILENIANHYEITQNTAYAKVTNVESELLEEYITDISLRRKVYSDRRNRKYADGGRVDEDISWDITIRDEYDNETFEINVRGYFENEEDAIKQAIKDYDIYVDESDYGKMYWNGNEITIWGGKKNYKNGGSIDEQTYIDLFEDYENIPAEVQMILDEYSESFEDGDYTGMSKAQDELKQIGYTFNFYVDGDAYGLRPIDVKLSQLKGYEDADEE